MTQNPFEPAPPRSPSENLLDTLSALGLTVRDLVRVTGLAPAILDGIIQGRTPVPMDKALLLEQTTGIPASVWIGLKTP